MKIEFWNIIKDDTFEAGLYFKRIHGEWTPFDKLTPVEIEIIFDEIKKGSTCKNCSNDS